MANEVATITRKSAPIKDESEVASIIKEGIITDKIYSAKTGELLEVRTGHNLIVNSFSTLIAILLKFDPNFTGIRYWAVGAGSDSDWDIPTMPQKFSLKVTKAATGNGNLNIHLFGMVYTVPVANGDSMANIATKIYNFNYGASWTKVIDGTDNTRVIFTATIPGDLSANSYFDPDPITGVTGMFDVEQEGTSDTMRPDPVASNTKLVNEFFRKEITRESVTFVNDAGEPTDIPTSSLAITVTFGPEEAIGRWREFGIFGGDATEARDSGYMINHKTHNLIDKSSLNPEEKLTIVREMRFLFG